MALSGPGGIENRPPEPPEPTPESVDLWNVVTVVLLALGVILIAVGVGAWRREPWLGTAVGGGLVFVVGMVMAVADRTPEPPDPWTEDQLR